MRLRARATPTASTIMRRATPPSPPVCIFEDIGYLMAAATAEGDRKRGAQQALIAKRVERAEQLGCSSLVSETLYMLEHSCRNLQRAGLREAYEKEVYEWNG